MVSEPAVLLGFVFSFWSGSRKPLWPLAQQQQHPTSASVATKRSFRGSTTNMSKTLFCIQMSRTLIILLTLIFIILSLLQVFRIFTELIPWPTYHQTVAILLDLVLAVGLIAGLTQHLKTLIFFSWLSALTFLLIFFGNTVSSQYQSDLIGMFYLLLICVLAFTDAVCIIKYRMPSEEAHHPFASSTMTPNQTTAMVNNNKCSPPPPPPQQMFDVVRPPPSHHHHHPDSLMVPPIPPPHHILHHHHHHQQQQQQQQPTSQQSFPPPPPPPPAAAAANVVQGSSSILTSPSSPLPPPIPTLNSHCYVSKNDPQFHAV